MNEDISFDELKKLTADIQLRLAALSIPNDVIIRGIKQLEASKTIVGNISYFADKEGIKIWGKKEWKTGSSENPATDTICFHSEQCVEKYLKAYLVLNDKEFRRTHNIAEILSLCINIDPSFEYLKDLKVYELTIYATELRYPEFFYIPSLKEAQTAVEIAEKTRDFVRRELIKEGLDL